MQFFIQYLYMNIQWNINIVDSKIEVFVIMQESFSKQLFSYLTYRV